MNRPLRRLDADTDAADLPEPLAAVVVADLYLQNYHSGGGPDGEAKYMGQYEFSVMPQLGHTVQVKSNIIGYADHIHLEIKRIVHDTLPDGPAPLTILGKHVQGKLGPKEST